jgi:hypothetical protein
MGDIEGERKSDGLLLLRDHRTKRSLTRSHKTKVPAPKPPVKHFTPQRSVLERIVVAIRGSECCGNGPTGTCQRHDSGDRDVSR